MGSERFLEVSAKIYDRGLILSYLFLKINTFQISLISFKPEKVAHTCIELKKVISTITLSAIHGPQNHRSMTEGKNKS